MKNNQIIGMVIGTLSFIGLIYFGGFGISICVFIIMWADNFSREK